MKFVIFVLSFLAVLYSSSSEDNNKNCSTYDSNDNPEVEGKEYPTVEYPAPDVGIMPQSFPTAPASTIRMRRSPPRFDPNKMKGKISRVTREKRDIDVGKIFKRVQDYMGGHGRKKRYIPEEVVPPVLKLVSETTE